MTSDAEDEGDGEKDEIKKKEWNKKYMEENRSTEKLNSRGRR